MFSGNAMLTTVGPATPGPPTWKCALLVPLGMFHTSMIQVSVWVTVFHVTVAVPNAPVVTPGAGASWLPDRFAVKFTVWARAGPAIANTTTAAAIVVNTRRIALLLRNEIFGASRDCGYTASAE